MLRNLSTNLKATVKANNCKIMMEKINFEPPVFTELLRRNRKYMAYCDKVALYDELCVAEHIQKQKYLSDPKEGTVYERFFVDCWKDSFWVEDYSWEIKFLEGGFNPYGNGQIKLNFLVSGLQTDSAAQTDILLLNGYPDTMVDLGYVNFSMTGRNFTTYGIELTRMQFVAQLALTPNSTGPAIQLVPSNWSGTEFKVTTSSDDLMVGGTPFVLASFSSNAVPVYLPDGRPAFFQTGIDRTIYVGPVFVPQGWGITIAIASNYMPTFPDAQIAYTMSNSPSLPSAGSTSVADVNIVGFSQVDQPLWVSTINPQAPVINPSPPNLLAGSFNAYGNEQIDVAGTDQPIIHPFGYMNPVVSQTYVENVSEPSQRFLNQHAVRSTRKNLYLRPSIRRVSANPKPVTTSTHIEVQKVAPFNEETVGDVHTRLLDIFKQVPGVTGEYGQLVLDPGFRMMEFTEGIDYAQEKENKSRRESQAISNGIQFAERSLNKKNVAAVDKDISRKIESADNKQLGYVIQRLMVKIKSWAEVVRVLLRDDKPVDTHMASLLIKAAVKKGVGPLDSSDYWIASKLAEGKKDGPIISGLSPWIRPLADLKSHPKWMDWYSSHFSGSKPRVFSDTVLAPNSSVGKVRLATRAAVANNIMLDQLTPEEQARISWGVLQEIAVERDDEVKDDLNGSHGETTEDDDLSAIKLIDLSGMIRQGFNPYGNGQPTNKVLFPNSMAEVESGNSTLSSVFYDSGTIAGPHIDPVFEVTEMTGVRGIQGVAFSSVANEMPLRAGYVSANNAATPLADLNHPECLLWPLELRESDDAAVVENPIRLPTRGVGTVRLNSAFGMVKSSDGLVVDAMVARQSNIRSNQGTAGGFMTSDIAGLLKTGGIHDGDSVMSIYLKLYLYMISRTWSQPVPFLPIGAEVGKLDTNASINPDPGVNLLYNAGSNNHNATCSDGLEPAGYIQPFGSVCQVAFHVTRATVPPSGYGNTFWIAPGLLMQNDRGNEAINIALTILGLAPYPCGFHQVAVNTKNILDDEAVQHFIPFSDLVNIPGPDVIHIILPITAPNNIPTTQAAANTFVLVRPTLGPTASTLGPAGQPLNVSFVGNVTYYDVSNFLYSWMADPVDVSPIDPTSIARFMNQIAHILRREKDKDFAYETACTLAVNYPAMVQSTEGIANFPVTIQAAMLHQNFQGLEPLLMTQDVPQQLTSWDTFVPSLNPMFWSCIMCGAYEAIEDGGIYPIRPRVFDGNPRLLQYIIMTTRYYAIVMNSLYICKALPTSVWNAAFTQLNFVGILTEIRGYFASASHTIDDPIFAENGYALAVGHCRLTGTAPARDMYGNTIYDYPNTPRVGYLSPITVDGDRLDGIGMCILADIWTQLNIKVKTLEMAPLLSSQKFMTGIPLTSGGVINLGAGSYMAPLTQMASFRDIALDTLPEIDSATLWNTRLVWHTFNSSLYTLDGNVYNVDVPPPNTIICQRAIFIDFSVAANVLPSLLTAHTSWFPYMTPDGRKLGIGVTAANNAARMTQVMSKRTTTAAAMWMVNGSYVMPNTIQSAAGSNTVSRLIRRPARGNASSSRLPASEEKGDGSM